MSEQQGCKPGSHVPNCDCWVRASRVTETPTPQWEMETPERRIQMLERTAAWEANNARLTQASLDACERQWRDYKDEIGFKLADLEAEEFNRGVAAADANHRIHVEALFNERARRQAQLADLEAEMRRWAENESQLVSGGLQHTQWIRTYSPVGQQVLAWAETLKGWR